MVKLLLQKMLRDMRKSIAAYGICLLIVAIGFCGYCLMSVAEDHLIASRDLLYERSSFADGFAEVQEAPAAITDKIKKIPGITDHPPQIGRQRDFPNCLTWMEFHTKSYRHRMVGSASSPPETRQRKRNSFRRLGFTGTRNEKSGGSMRHSRKGRP